MKNHGGLRDPAAGGRRLSRRSDEIGLFLVKGERNSPLKTL